MAILATRALATRGRAELRPMKYRIPWLARSIGSLPTSSEVVGTIKWRVHHTRALLWRRLLLRSTVVAITGSCGKTTTKELVSSCLRQIGTTASTQGSWSGLRFGGIAATILSASFRDRFVAVETGIEKPGEMRHVATLLKPNVVVVTWIATAHVSHFGNLDRIAAEKGILVEQCNPQGFVVLNRDDGRVYTMRKRTKARVITFGSHPDSDVRCLELNATWPSRLSLKIKSGTQCEKIASQLVGAHWNEAILASVATSQALGLPLAHCVDQIASVEPVWARMQPIVLPSGATFIRDDYHGSPHDFETAFKLCRTAVASRKVLVASAYGDSNERSLERMRVLAETAHDIFYVFVFFGEKSKAAVRVLKGKGVNPELLFESKDVRELVQFLRETLRAGDLVLLKGRTNTHMSRIYLGVIGDVKCTLQSCTRQILCDRCPKLGFSWREELKPYMAPPDCYL